jgi:hypothetical protein
VTPLSNINRKSHPITFVKQTYRTTIAKLFAGEHLIDL